MNQKKKNHWIKIMREHEEADRLIQGQWIEDKDDEGIYRGCFFGCAMQTDDVPILRASWAMGLPYSLIVLVTYIYEGLPKPEAIKWPVQFLEAIPVDADLDNVLHLVAIKRMERLIELHEHIGEECGLLNALRKAINYNKNPTRVAAEAVVEASRMAAQMAVELSVESDTDSELLAACSAWSSVELKDLSAKSAAESAKSVVESAKFAADSAVNSEVCSSIDGAWSEAWISERDALIDVLNSLKLK